MGFQIGGGNNGGGSNTPEILIPMPKIEVNNRVVKKKLGNLGIITALIYSDVQISQEWLNYHPKIYLLRYKSKKSSLKRRKSSIDGLLIPARWAMTTDKIGKNAPFSWDVDTTNVHQNQATLPKYEFRRNGATQIKLDLNFFFKKIMIIPTSLTIWVSNQANYGNAGVDMKKLRYISRVNEYFKFVYGIEKDGKIYFGDMSTQTLKTKMYNQGKAAVGLASVI
jgi:hypothetical protein